MFEVLTFTLSVYEIIQYMSFLKILVQYFLALSLDNLKFWKLVGDILFSI